MRRMTIMALFLSPSLAGAQGLIPGASSVGIGANEREEVVVIRSEDCARLIAHVPAADVAYQPGIDAAGNAVAPADIGGRFKPPAVEDLVLTVEIDLGEKYGIPPRKGRHDMIALGRVVFQNGKAHFNGQPLATDDELALAAACQRYDR